MKKFIIENSQSEVLNGGGWVKKGWRKAWWGFGYVWWGSMALVGKVLNITVGGLDVLLGLGAGTF